LRPLPWPWCAAGCCERVGEGRRGRPGARARGCARWGHPASPSCHAPSPLRPFPSISTSCVPPLQSAPATPSAPVRAPVKPAECPSSMQTRARWGGGQRRVVGVPAACNR
jgi:hypothetical protein